MLKRIVLVAGLVLAVSGTAMAQDEGSTMSAGLALTYKGIDTVKPVWGIQGRLGYVFTENIDATLNADLYFQPKGQAFYGGSFGPAVHYNFVGESALTPYVGVGANIYFRDKFPGGSTFEVNAGAKYALGEPWALFGEVASEFVKTKVFNKTPFSVRAGLNYGF